MALSLAEKKAVVAEVADVAKSSVSAVAADYRGLSVVQMAQLRKTARDSGVYLRVVRNTLSRRAFAGTDFECLTDILVGPLFLAFSREEPSAAARVVRDFAKDNAQLEVKALSINGKLLDASNLDAVASLPTYDEALSKLLYVLKAPITQFVRTLAEPHAQLVRTVAAIRDKKKSES